jgi:Tol biopolymer transport system component
MRNLKFKSIFLVIGLLFCLGVWAINLPCQATDAVLYAGMDPVTGNSDIFAVNPNTGKTVNLTNGNIPQEAGWSQPWEPVGNSHHNVLCRQFGYSNGNTISRIFLLDVKPNQVNITQLEETFDSAHRFTWSNNNKEFAFINKGSSNQLVIVSGTTVIQKIDLPLTGFCTANWSPNGKWIAVSSTNENLLLISAQDYSITPLNIVLSDGLNTNPNYFGSDKVTWGNDSERLAVVEDGILKIISLQGDYLQIFGTAHGVDSWSHDGKYLVYMVRDATTYQRQLYILFLGGTNKIDTPYDCSSAVWAPQKNIAAFWGETSDTANSSLMVVGFDGKNPKIIGPSYFGSYMPPSWCKIPMKMFKK